MVTAFLLPCVPHIGHRASPAFLPLWFWPLWLSGQTIFRVEAELRRFGANVRAARVARGWTQEELAHRTGLASVQVSRIERGKREVRLSTLLRLVRALDVPPAALLDGLICRTAPLAPAEPLSPCVTPVNRG
jgi:DNA-binding Xre family transcriptional regulator